MKKPFGEKIAKTFSVVAALFILAPFASAQISFSGSTGSGSHTLVDEATVVENAVDAFASSVDQAIDEADLSPSQTEAATRVTANVRERFARETRQAIKRLKGDGILTASEVTEELEALRSDLLDRLDQSLNAIAGGYSPPPAADEFDDSAAYARALAGYTFKIRNSLSDWLVLAGALGGGLIAAWLVSTLLRSVARRLRERDRRRTGEFAEAFIGPLYLAVLTISLRIGFEWIWIPGVANNVLENIVNVALLASLFWLLWNACTSIARGLAWLVQKTYHKKADQHVVLVASRALRLVLVGVFSLIFIRQVLDSNLTGFIAGLGVLGVVASFILKGTIENIAASFTLFSDEPFRVGDLVVFDDKWGKIEDIGFRSTRFRTLDGHLITIPNSKLVDDAIHNVGARPSIRRRFRIGLAYDTPPDKMEEALEIVRDLLDDHRGQPDDQPAHVALEGFGDYDLQILIQYYFEPADYWKALEFDTELNLSILKRFNEAGIEIAYPTQRLHVDTDRASMDEWAIEESDDSDKAA